MGYFDDTIEHHGVRGMKWGVRRYQNYDGTYTQAGLKRFNKSLGEYEKANERYKNVKSNQKALKKMGVTDVVTKGDVTNAKLARKNAKRKLEKDYKHLKQDKLGDQGKELYAKGKTITGNSEVTKLLNTVGSVALSAAAYNQKSGGVITKLINQYTGLKISDDSFLKVAGGVGVGALGTSAAKKVADEYQNKRLRAYYGHTSNY